MAPLFRAPVRAGHKKTAPRARGTVDVYSLPSTQRPLSVGKIIKPRRRETVLSVTLHWPDSKANTPESQIGVGTTGVGDDSNRDPGCREQTSGLDSTRRLN